MKSKLFEEYAVLPKEFAEDIAMVVTLEIPEDVMDLLPQALNKYLVVQDSRSESDALENIREIWPIKLEEFNAVVKLGSFLLAHLDIDDTTEDIINDIKTTGSIQTSQIDKLSFFVNVFVNKFKDFYKNRLTIAAQKTGLKRISGIAHVVDFRTVVANRPKINDEIEQYQPNVISLVPVAILQIQLTGEDDFVLQMDKFALKILKDELIQIEKEMDKTISFIGEDKITIPER